MKKINIILFLIFSVTLCLAQSARLQLIHNSPSPSVDVWVNGEKAIANFQFRTATEFADVPANTPLKVEIKLPNSVDTTSAVATFDVTLDAGKRYVAIATGIVGNTQTPFTLKVLDYGLESSSDASKVALAVYHGSTDAPSVDVTARGIAKLVAGASYGDATPYFEVPAGKYLLDITPKDKTNPIVATFEADLTQLGGGAGVVFASGFLTPQQGAPAFGLFAALPNGDVVALPRLIVNTKELVDIEAYKVYPTVVSTVTNVAFTLKDNSAVRMVVSDNNGRVIRQYDLGLRNSGAHLETYDLTNWTNGIYYFNLITQYGNSTQRVIKSN